MPKKRALSFAGDATEASLWGPRADERYDDLDLEILAQLPALTDVVLVKQRITRLPVMPHVTRLHLGELALASLDGIEHMHHLQRVTLAGIAGLDLERAFDQLAELPELAVLELWGTNIGVLPKSVTKLHSLRSICFNDTPKLAFAEGFALLATLPHLRTLSFLDRTRMRLPDAFGPLKQVTSLELLFYLSYLPPSIGHMTKLETLLLERNRFTELPATFGQLANLAKLDVPNSKIKVIPDELCRCTSLVDLNLWGNPIKELPARFGDLVKLEKLALHHTKLKTLPVSFSQLAKLREVSLPDSVTSVPDAFYELSLVELQAAATITNRMKLAAPEALDEDEVALYEPDRIPASLGQPHTLRVHCALDDAGLARLAPLTRLVNLHIQADAVRVIGALTSARRLEMINITDGTKVVPSLARFPALTRLHLWGPIETLPEDLASVSLRIVGMPSTPALIERITEVRSLEELELRSETKVLPAAIGKLIHLTRLGLECHLASLPDELASCTALATLGMWGNPRKRGLGNLAVLGRLPALRSLTLARFAHVDLVALCKALANTPLELLDLTSTELGELPPEIGLLTKVTRIDLTRTGVRVLPPEIARCAALRRLDFASYQLADRKAAKQRLPVGRWKQDKGRELSFVRTD